MVDRYRAVAAEGVATAFLLAAIVGSGVMGERLSSGNHALSLLVNSLATGAALVALIVTFGAISGAHMNPLVTLLSAIRGEQHWRHAVAYVLAQFSGGAFGVVAAHIMFGLPPIQSSLTRRTGLAEWISEIVATFGLIAVIGGSHRKSESAPLAIGLYVVAAYWFTGSTAFANPAVTWARSLTNTFAGIHAGDVPAFVVAQCIGALFAGAFWRWIEPTHTSMGRGVR